MNEMEQMDINDLKTKKDIGIELISFIWSYRTGQNVSFNWRGKVVG